jgi:hypothetical protein
MIDIPILLDYIALAPAKARARRTDPQTSHDAATYALSSTAQYQRNVIINLVRLHHDNGGITNKEIALKSSIPYESVKRRASDCKNAGLIYRDEENVHGREGCSTWLAS